MDDNVIVDELINIDLDEFVYFVFNQHVNVFVNLDLDFYLDFNVEFDFVIDFFDDNVSVK